MYKRLPLLLCAALLLCLFSACSGGTTSTATIETTPAVETAAEPAPAQETTASTAEPSVPETTPAQAESPAQEAVPAQELEAVPETSVSAEDEVHANEPVSAEPVEEETPAAVIEYPLEGNPSISLWSTLPDGPTARLFTSRSEQWALPYAKEATGVELTYIEAPSSNVTEQFNLMVAAGDYADLLPAANYYTGGLTKALFDEVVIALNEEALAVEAPQLWAVYQAQNEATWATMREGGQLLAFYSIDDELATESGQVTRGDWLEALGVDFGPDLTLEEFTDYLYLCKETYGCEYTIVPTSSATMNDFYGFDMVTIPDISGDTVDMATYVEEEQVLTAWNADAYRSYIEWFSRLYTDSIVPIDFYTDSIDQMAKDAYVLADQVAVWNANADNCTELEARADAGSSFRVEPIPSVVQTTIADCAWISESSLATVGNSVSCDCQDLTLVYNYMNYWFTAEGSKLFCCGPKGVTWIDIDENGEYIWTEEITDNENGFNVGQACKMYSMIDMVSGLFDTDRLYNVYSETGARAIEVWSMDGASTVHYYPSGASLTAEESDRVTTQMTDLCTLASERIMRWITGSEVLDDEAWAAYCNQLEAYGLNDIMAVYQNAYSEYLAGVR